MKIPCLLLFLFPAIVFGQVTTIDTNKDVSHWLDSIKTLPLTQQLYAIKQRAISDTNTYVCYRQFVCREGLKGRYVYKTPVIGNKKEVSCKPSYWIGGYPFMNDDTKNKDGLLKFQQALEKVKIDTILSLQGTAAEALLGSDAVCGAVLIVVKDKRSRKWLSRSRSANK
ncbi:hypothetical protein L3C95_16560 [Chitinophaga filiformis]|uniref:hypothetical protein n=1 Tax=Chitinophaga filiformis TaxID=104663 RepID=UPI001F28E817|nr:hypothetical protein [Chitinophaga filiformis]MCF6404511.1 hypothetical protein [Chitinophaga filiformis]